MLLSLTKVFFIKKKTIRPLNNRNYDANKVSNPASKRDLRYI